MTKPILFLIVVVALIFFILALLTTNDKLNNALQPTRDPTTDSNREKGSNEWVDPTGNYKG